MRRQPGPDFHFRCFLFLSAWMLCISRQCLAEGITRFTQRYVMVNVDGEEISEEDEKGSVKDRGICPYVDVFLAGEISGSVSRLVPEDSFLCGSHKAGKYFRIGVGRQGSTLTVPATGEDSEIPWYVLFSGSRPYTLTQYMFVRDRQLSTLFDGQRFQAGFQVYYENQTYLTSGFVMKVSGYAGTENKDAFTVYEDWFRSRYNHNYEICYDYGFVRPEKRGFSPEQGTLHENLSYFALPKQLSDPGGDSRYQFLGWRLSGEGTEYTPAQGSDKASFRYGQPAGSAAAFASLAALSLAEPEDPVEAVAETAAVETAVTVSETAAETEETTAAAATASSLRREACMDISSG